MQNGKDKHKQMGLKRRHIEALRPGSGRSGICGHERRCWGQLGTTEDPNKVDQAET